jgi:lipopolysaccharide biosynthesis glycosyltransferase
MDYKMQMAYHCSLALKGMYATRIGADFLVKTTKTLHHLSGWQSPERMEMGKFFDTYDRILYLDADTIVKPETPDMFEVFNDPDSIYMLNEATDPNADKTRGSLASVIRKDVFPFIISQRGDFSPRDGQPYYNAGVMLCSRKHRHIFDVNASNYFEQYRFEQDYLNYQIWKQGHKVTALPIEYNGIWLLIKEKDEYFDRVNVIHYIGVDKARLADMMLNDFTKLGVFNVA